MLSTWFKNKNMKSSGQKEEPEDKRKYVFFSDPDVVAKRAETSAITAQIKLDLETQRQTIENQLTHLQTSAFDLKSLENLLSYHPVQPYPFPFISAVKRKLALGDCINTGSKAYDPNSQAKSLTSSVLKAKGTQNLCQIVQKMDYIKPLKVPDLKISPKTLDFSSRDNSVSKELPSTKSEIIAKEFAHDRSDRTLRTGDKVQRKLDFFFPDGSSIINCENIEPLKAPNVSIASNLCKKKDHVRDSSREKENKSKRMKKDDSLCAKRDESVREHTKRSRSPRHISRKDTSNISNVRLQNDKSFHATKNNDFLSMKLKDKNALISTVKKDNDKRQKFFNAQSVELKDNSVDSIGRVSSSEPLVISSDKVTLRDNNNSVSCNNTETKSKDICHMMQRSEIENLKSDSDISNHSFDLDNRQLKEDKSNSIYKEQLKRVFDKNKILSSRLDGKQHNINSEQSEDIGSMSDTNSSKNCVYHINSMPPKNKDLEMVSEIKQNINFARSIKTDELKYTEHSEAHLTSTSTKKNEESYSQSVGTSKETTTNDDSNNVDVSSTLPEALFDPRRISFRDSYSQQEFNDLITPEKINLVKTKRRRNLIPSSDSEVDARCPKYKPTVKSEKEQEEGQLMHPKALHKQFQAELQLYETFNESLRQVIDVEKCLYNTKCEQEKKNLQKNEELEEIIEDGCTVAAVDSNIVEKARNLIDYSKKNVSDIWRPSDEAHFIGKYYVPTNQTNVVESAIINYGNKAAVKVTEVQAKTVHDIATQTKQKNTQNKLSEMIEKLYEQSSSVENDIAEHSLNSIEQFENLDQIEDISVPSRIRTMSEISLHETTSSIKTETGTEISISTRDVTFSINQYLDLEIEQLIRDENHRCNKMEELLKSREKTLSDKTKKLIQLEEQKRALRDTGQDSRSVKKKQRALLLKLQQEAEYLCKIKKLHQQASQERMDMLRKQRNMFNPEMSTRNILTKLKRSADSQSPRRLSGPMKGYDIRSNSSRSSVIESDKSQHDYSNIEPQQGSESDVHSIKFDLIKSDDAKNKELREKDPMSPKRSDISMHELRSRKYEEKMPRADILQRKQNQRNMESKRIQGHPMNIKRLLENQESSIGTSKLELINASVLEKSESDTIVEELSKKSKTSQAVDLSMQTATIVKEKDSTSNIVTASNESIEEDINTIAQDTVSKTTQISEDILQTNTSKSSKKIDKSVMSDRDISKKSQYNDELSTNSKHKNFKYQKMKSPSNTLTENILQSKSSSRLSNELKHQDKRIQLEHELLHLDSNNKSSILGELDFNVSQELLQTPVKHSKLIKDKNLKLSETSNNYKSKENVFSQINRKLEHDESCRNKQNTSTSQISTFAISHRSSKESEKNLSKSVVVRSQDRHLEQLLIARETALASRKNCIKEWMAWHARLRAEEDRVNRMEQAAFKLVATYSNVLNQQDTTISSDTSDVEGRIGYLTEKLEERRIEMARLKREAKKETKKQLRALETNLLNQIKKYDMTIHEMRKKLETKKTKETDKLAIEPKSLAEFKVPEIPLKRIQNIYKSSDLLRSKSESDLLITRNQQKDPLKGLLFTTPITYDDKYEKNSSKKSVKYTDTKSTNISESKDTNQIVSDEYTSTEVYDKIRTTTSKLSTTNDAHLEKYVLSKEMQIEESGITRTKQSSISSAEDVETNLDTAKSESEVQTLSDARSVDHSTINTESTNNELMTNVDPSQPKMNLTIQSEIQEMGNDSIKSISSKSNYSTESTARTVADSDILTYSKKLDFLQLNNKNLSEDISAIENGIKVFSEIMSRLNESNEKSKINDERNTSQDISEIISKSVFSDKIVDIANEEKHTTSGETTDSLSISTNNEKSKSPKSNDLSHDNNKSDEINSEISAIISEEVQLSDLDREIDYEAKSKEIMNEIEKSIISEQIKIVHDDYNAATSVSENEDKDLLNDLASELEVKSISEIFSKMSESRRNLDRATTTATQIIDDSRKRINERSVNLNKDKLEKDFVKGQTEETCSLKFSERPHSPIIAGHCSKENSETQSHLQSVHSAVPSQVLQVVASKDSKSSDNIPEMLEAEIGIDIRILKNLDEDETSTVFEHSKHSMVLSSNQNQSHAISTENISQDRDNWLTSDSFQIPQDEVSTGERNENLKSHVDHTNNASNNFSKENVETRCVDDATNPEVEINLANNINESACIPKEESTKVEMHDITFNNILTESHVMKSNDELDDILDIIARENNRGESISKESGKLDNVISDSMTELLEKVKDIVENDGSVDNHFKGILCDIGVNDETEVVSNFSSLNNKTQDKTNVENITESNVDFPSTCNDNKSSNSEKIMDIPLQAVDETGDKSAVRVNLHVEIDNEESPREAIPEIQEIIITELDSDSVEDNVLSELEIDAKVELAEDEESTASCVSENENRYTVKEKKDIIEIKECLESILEQDSSDGEQLDNLVEVAESGLDTVEKIITSSHDFPVIDNTIFVDESTEEKTDDTAGKVDKIITISDTPVNENLNKTFDILKDPEYEDISEESLEVSEILDKTDLKAGTARKSFNLSDKYQATQKSEEVLRILDEISQRSSDSISNSQKNEKSAAQSETQEEISELLDAEVSAEDDSPSPEMKKITRSKVEEKSYKVNDESKNRFLKDVELQDEQPSMEAINDIGSPEEKDRSPLRLDADDDDKSTRIAYELQEQDGSSGESSEAGDTPRGVSDIEMDSPRDFNDSRLDIDILDDELLSDTKAMTDQNDVKTNFHSSSIVATSENDITAMINKLKASLEQPGQEVAELQAKLLRIEQLQIELEIKKLEAEEVSFYVREIPNKPPPPYTPPGDGRLSASLGSPSMTPAVIPSNVEELTSFTEKATILIYNAKQAGEDIANLEAPVEIYDSITDKINEDKDRRIYNTFLFDLCKEIIVEVFRAEYEKPGPSWTKPNVKTKPAMKIPKTMEDLVEYVNQEVATLFGFKTKLQRENMVMRWSRKRRDRVDELLAREAQAEEDEWTKFHHDELVVKNGLTVAILDTLMMETANIVKIAYGKKRRIMV
ncbi:centrosome-associated protein 350 [Camponotus floridanus]|uniref:centrosome-associated protein 350 n=1 Tax=Camponotus floridanus TaxID=104421 RepID=UPI000DC66AD0|nr:centrosome-associated protein 350 [Camponotus floridanus]